ncbi:MAG: hypothetical protein JO134_14945 [Xanthobacteraceae bacterium]|nr:hypothetical protein [Xanthobacteraceae bacterium]
MTFVEQIEGAPKNGDVIILRDESWQALGRWDQEANRWVHPDGTPVGFSPTHWKPSDASLPGDETGQTHKGPFTGLMLLALVAVTCIAGFVFWIASEDRSSLYSATNLERLSREQDRASVAPRPENIPSTKVAQSKQIATSEQSELKQALDQSEARAEALTRELTQTRELADARLTELKAALDESERTVLALARELHNTIASADKPAVAEETTRGAISSGNSPNPSREEVNAASGLTGIGPANAPSRPAKLDTAGGGWFACDSCLQNTDEAAAPEMTAMKPSRPRRLPHPRGGLMRADR